MAKKKAQTNINISLGKWHIIIGVVIIVLIIGALLYLFIPGEDGARLGFAPSLGEEELTIESDDEATAAVTEFSSDISNILDEIESIDSGLGG